MMRGVDRRAPDPQDGGRCVGCVVPSGLIECDPCAPGEMVEAVELEAVIGAVGEPCVDVAGGEVVPPYCEGAGDEKCACASSEVGHSRRPRELEAFLECRWTDRCEVSCCDDRPDTKDEFFVAELFRQGEGSLCERPVVLRIGFAS